MENKEPKQPHRIHFSKPPSWLFYTFIITFSVLLIFFLVWRYTPVKDEVEARIIRQLQPYLGESFYITDFSIGSDNLSFYNVRAANPGAGFSVEFAEIRFSFAPSKLLTYNFDPVKTINNVKLIRPQVTLYYSDEPRQINPDLSLEKVFEEIITNIKKFPEIDHVKIRDGSVVLQMPWQTTLAEKQIPLFSGLNGRLDYLASNEEVTLALDGELLGTENSGIKLTGYVDFGFKRWEATVDFLESYVTSNLPFWKINFWQIENARLSGSVQVINEHFDMDSLMFNGDVQVKDMRMAIYNQHTEIDSFYLRFEGQDVLIDTFDCRIEDGRARFGGMLYNVLHPEADWRLSVWDFSASHLKQSHSIFEYAYEGKVAGNAHFSGPIKTMDIHAEARCPDLLYAVVPFNTVRTRLDYNVREKILRFPYLRADFFEFRTQGTGYVNFNTDTLSLDLASDIEVPDDYFNWMTGLNNGKVLVDTDFYGNFRQKDFRGGFVYQGVGVDTLLAIGRGPFTLDDQLLRFNVRTDDVDDDFQLSGVIHKLFSGPQIEILDFNDFPMSQLSYNPVVKSFLDKRHIHMFFSGPYYSLATKAKLVPEDDQLRQIVTAFGNITDIFLDNQRYRGKFRVNSEPKEINGDFDVAFDVSGVNIRVNAPDVLQANVFQGSKSDSPYTGTVTLEKFSLQDYLANSPEWSNVLQEGNLQGELRIDGTVENPGLRFNLGVQDLVVNGVGYYNAIVDGAFNNHRLDFSDLWVRLNSDTVANALLSWDAVSDSLSFRMNGSNLESNFLAETIFGDPDVIDGSLSYAIKANGLLAQPQLTGSLHIGEGHLLDENVFHGIELAVADSLIEGGNFWQIDHHIVNVRRFLYHNRDAYDVNVAGFIGIQEYAPMDLKVNARGNVLAELPQILPYFIDPKTDGKLYARIVGSRGNPLLDEIDLQVYDGSMAFDGVVPPITNLKVDVKLSENDNFIHIRNIEALVQGRRARIYNQPSVTTTDGQVLEPWFFEDVGLNLGVLSLETAENGIPLHFPGMMEEGDIGFFTASGRLPGEAFYFAGPPDLPLCRGTTQLFNCRVTFPFIGMYDESGEYVYDENDRVIEFMMNMRWDMKSLPGNNNRYFVSIPGYVGEVFMDLNIDNNSEGFVYTGRLIDESFRVDGSVESSRGRVEYLDVNFRVERFGAEFNVYEIYPEVYGTAYTTVRTEEYDPVFGVTGGDTSAAAIGGESVPRDILLKLYVTDPVTGKEVSKGRWEDFRFKLISRENPYGETQEQLLASLGYSFRNLQYKAGEVGLTLTQNFLIRPLFRPIERQLERKLRLDYVRVRSNFASYLLYLSFQDRTKIFNRPTFLLVNNNLDPALQLLQSSELTLGKYVLKDVYMSYTGQLVAGVDDSKLGVNHTLGVEYRLLYNWLLEVEMSKFQFDPFYNIDNSRDLSRDFRIRLRRSITF